MQITGTRFGLSIQVAFDCGGATFGYEPMSWNGWIFLAVLVTCSYPSTMRSKSALLAVGVALLGGLCLVVLWTASRLAFDKHDDLAGREGPVSSHGGLTRALAVTGPAPAGHTPILPDQAQRRIAAAAATQPAPPMTESVRQQPLAVASTSSTEARRTLQELNDQVLSEPDVVRRRRLARGRLLWLEYEAKPLRWHIDRAVRMGTWTAAKLARQRKRLQEVEGASAAMQAELRRLEQGQ